MNHNNIDSFLSTYRNAAGHILSVEFKWNPKASECIFDLYLIAEYSDETNIFIVFNDIDRLKIIQPSASGILMDIRITPEEGQGPFRQKQYLHVYDAEEQWINFYCTDFFYEIVPIS